MSGQAIGKLSESQYEVKQPSHVDRELSGLECSATRLEEIAISLADRLQSVLHFNASAETKAGAPDEVIAPLADRIRVSRKRFELLERQLKALIESIEL